MKYPAIVYNLDRMDAQHADNLPYTITKRYQVTIMDRDPDSFLPTQVANLPMCFFNRFFVADGLNHFVFSLYF